MAAISIVLLGLGYAGSQLSYPDLVSVYAAKLDVPSIRLLATAIFVAAIVFAILPDSTESDE